MRISSNIHSSLFRGEQLGDLVRLIVTDFKHHPTSGRNHVRYLASCANRRYHREPIRAAVQELRCGSKSRTSRLKTVDDPPVRYIRRICNQHMEGPGDVFKSVCMQPTPPSCSARPRGWRGVEGGGRKGRRAECRSRARWPGAAHEAGSREGNPSRCRHPECAGAATSSPPCRAAISKAAATTVSLSGRGSRVAEEMGKGAAIEAPGPPRIGATRAHACRRRSTYPCRSSEARRWSHPRSGRGAERSAQPNQRQLACPQPGGGRRRQPPPRYPRRQACLVARPPWDCRPDGRRGTGQAGIRPWHVSFDRRKLVCA